MKLIIENESGRYEFNDIPAGLLRITTDDRSMILFEAVLSHLLPPSYHRRQNDVSD